MVSSRLAPRTTSTTRLAWRGEVERGLTGRVRGPDDVDLVALAWLGFAGRRAVVDAAAGELVDARGLESPVGHPGRDDQRAGLDLARVLEEHGVHRAARLDADDVAGQHHLGAEARRPGRPRDG